jgi:hypothetical protein
MARITRNQSTTTGYTIITVNGVVIVLLSVIEDYRQHAVLLNRTLNGLICSAAAEDPEHDHRGIR